MYVVGADCGGTSTKVLVAGPSGELIGRGRGGPGNVAVQGYAGVIEAVREGVLSALAHSDTTWDDLINQGAVIAAGVSGTSIPGSIERLTQGFLSLGFDKALVEIDAQMALIGALSGEDGAIVISGTGSIALGRKDGYYHRVGGWGYLLGDEGSSFWIAQQAIMYLLRAHDGTAAPNSELEEALLTHFKISAIPQILEVVYRSPIDRGLIGSFTPIIVQLAQAGNSVCQQIVAEAGRELGRLAGAVVVKAGLAGAPCRVGACGGVFSAGGIIIDPLQRALSERAPLAKAVEPDFEPVVGSLLAGYALLGLTAGEVLPNIRTWANRGGIDE